MNYGNEGTKLDEELEQVKAVPQDSLSMGLKQPNIPSWLVPITNATIDVIIEFIGGFREDFKSKDSWKAKTLRLSIRTAISAFILVTLMSASLFLLAQIKSQWLNLIRPASEHSLLVPNENSAAPSSLTDNGESETRVPNQTETGTVDALDAGEHTEGRSSNSTESNPGDVDEANSDPDENN